MSLTARIAILIAAVLLPALLGSLWIHTATARDALLTQLELRNRDAAAALALSLSQQQGDVAAMSTVAGAQFELGAYRRASLTAADGRVLWQREAAAATADPAAPPAWFSQAWPLRPAEGVATVSHGWQPIGTLRIEAQVAWAQAALWAAVTRTALLLAGLGAAAALLAAWALRRWQRPLTAAVQQARDIEAGRFTLADEPALPELRTLTRSMNAMVVRLRELFDAQAAQVALLQRQAQTDPVTGVMQRPAFVARLGARLADAQAPPIALLIVRLARVQRLNDEIGFEATDRLLATLAEALLAYGERVPGAFAGRLNGSDFALVLPAVGVATETASSLLQAFSNLPMPRRDTPGVSIGGADGLAGVEAGAALAAADAALAQAEIESHPVVRTASMAIDGAGGEPTGARAWRDQIAAALDAGRTRLAEFPVVDRNGELLHLDCPLRVQFGSSGPSGASGDDEAPAPWRPAREWLAQAARSRLLPRIDLAALDLALAAICRDGRPRCVHLAPRSMAAPGFAAQVQARLVAAPEAARGLSLEWVDGDRVGEADRSAIQAAAAWRALGVRLGIEHAGGAPQRLRDWQAIGLDFVKVDPRHLRGLADDEAVRAYAAGLVALIHGLGWKALAEGVDDPRDGLALWTAGFDGVTGRAVEVAAG
jgi:GGDEF domain-containing protein/EAL domain-containing protein (putative c-di-GMP-specific phosphodiesterase class I)